MSELKEMAVIKSTNEFYVRTYFLRIVVKKSSNLDANLIFVYPCFKTHCLCKYTVKFSHHSNKNLQEQYFNGRLINI